MGKGYVFQHAEKWEEADVLLRKRRSSSLMMIWTKAWKQKRRACGASVGCMRMLTQTLFERGL
jgi:hypothetical protein